MEKYSESNACHSHVGGEATSKHFGTIGKHEWKINYIFDMAAVLGRREHLYGSTNIQCAITKKLCSRPAQLRSNHRTMKAVALSHRHSKTIRNNYRLRFVVRFSCFFFFFATLREYKANLIWSRAKIFLEEREFLNFINSIGMAEKDSNGMGRRA